MKQIAFPLSLLLSALFQPSLAYKWPNPQLDEADHFVFDKRGYKSNGVSNGVPTCDGFGGFQVAAQWLRTAFHDAATHDAAAGTGGLDASLAVELERPENSGPGLGGTIGFFLGQVTPRTSLADLIALGVLAVMDSCGGAEIPYRAGRVDDFNPSPPGVPQPQESLQSHISAFSRMGFTQEEMIGLVACGHTIGGVHTDTHPEIVPPEAAPIQHFDSTFTVFDNKVATEFVAGIPNNPLAFGANDTTNSDFRIFSSDGNRTISSFAEDENVYQSTCGRLFERMLNSVPSQVTLTDVVNPLPVKPTVFLDIKADGTLSFTGEVRFFNMASNPNRVVKLMWTDRNGQCAQGTCSSTATHSDEQVTFSREKQSLWYSFAATIDSEASISRFWFEVDESDGSPPKQMNSETGAPFPFESRMFIVPSMSCNTQNNNGDFVMRTTIAMRANSQPVDPRVLVTNIATGTPSPLAYTRTDSTVAATLSANSTSPHYQLYTAEILPDNFGGVFFDIAAQIGGEEVRDPGWQFFDLFNSPFQCAT